MKNRNHFPVYAAVAFICTLIILGGCTTTGMERSVSTSKSIQVVDDDIRKFSTIISETSASLDFLIKTKEADLKRAFDIFAENVVKLDVQGKVVIKHTEEMRVRSTEYFSEWEKQGNAYTNPKIRALSADRRNELEAIYARVPAAAAGIEPAYLIYQSDLNEIQLFLSNDLTPNGIKSITSIVQKTVLDLRALTTKLTPVLTALDDIKSELYDGAE